MQRLLLGLAGIAVGIYYRRERLGRRVPAEGPVLLVGNHPNGLVDPVLVAGTTDRPLRFLGKAPLFELPVLGAVMRGLEVLPVYRAQDDADTALNERTFDAVFGALGAGELVCLFPEGRSHDAPSLQRLKTGAARMALGAEARAASALGVRIVPVGLVYRAKRRFRSRAATWVGEAIEVRDLAELHRRDERAAVRALTERIAAGLASVTLELDRWEDLPLLELAGRISASAGAHPFQRVQRFARGVRELREKDPERVEALAERIGAFRDRLQLLGVDLEHLDVRYRPASVLRYAARKVAPLVLGLPLALAGTLFWAVPYFVVPRIPRRMGTSRDIHATVQILAGLVLFPAWGLALSALAWLRFGPLAGAGLLVALLPLFLAALWLRDFGKATLADVAAFRRLAPRRTLQQDLRAERSAIAAEIEAVARELASR
jgi:glycerol-3-phosphate O-acyltransferase/dihydroxyacetone phosphate acyltransferase